LGFSECGCIPSISRSLTRQGRHPWCPGRLGNRGAGRIFDLWVNIKGRRRFRNELSKCFLNNFNNAVHRGEFG